MTLDTIFSTYSKNVLTFDLKRAVQEGDPRKSAILSMSLAQSLEGTPPVYLKEVGGRYDLNKPVYLADGKDVLPEKPFPSKPHKSEIVSPYILEDVLELYIISRNSAQKILKENPNDSLAKQILNDTSNKIKELSANLKELGIIEEADIAYA